MAKYALRKLAALGLAVLVFAAPAWAGVLKAGKVAPNPGGTLEQVYVLDGQAQEAAAERIDSLPALPRLEAGRRVKLTLFHFNDLHNHLTIPHQKKGATHYFSQMYKKVDEAREQAGPDEVVLFVSAGDDHTGSVLDELLGWDEASFGFSPAYRVYSAGGLDMAVIGNHELDRGAEILAKAIASDARFPLLSANLQGSKFIGPDHYHPAALAVAKGLTIGFIGLTTPVDTHTGEADDPDLKVAGPVQTMRNLLPLVADNADLVIILSHCGFGEATGAADRHIAEGDVALAKEAGKLTKKPVIIVGGHTHTALNAEGLDPQNVINGVPILQTHGRAKTLGLFQAVAESKDGKVALSQIQAGLIPLKVRDDRKKQDDPDYAKLEHDSDYDQEFEQKNLDPILAQLEKRLDMVIAQVEAGPELSTESTIADRYLTETALANFMNDAVVEMSKNFPNGEVDLALFNASGVNSGIPTQGPLTFADWYSVMPYADTIQVGAMSGRQIKEMLENNAKRLVRPEEMKGDQPVNLKGYVSRGFLHFSKGLRYTLKLNGSAAQATVQDITIKGRPIEEVLDQKFKVAFNSYIGAGGFGEAWNGQKISAGVKGDIIGFDLRSLPKLDTGLVYRNEIVEYIKTKGLIGPDNGAAKDGRLAVLP